MKFEIKNDNMQCGCPSPKVFVLPVVDEKLPVVPGKIAGESQNLLTFAKINELKPGQALKVQLPSTDANGEAGLQNVILYKEPTTLNAHYIVKLAVKLAGLVKTCSNEKVILCLTENLKADLLVAFLNTFKLEFAPFITYMSAKQEAAAKWPEICKVNAKHLTEAVLEKVEHLSTSVAMARRFANEPANVMTPTRLAAEAEKALTPLGVKVTVLGRDEAKALGMEAFLSVARGSAQEPKLIVMEYDNNKDSDQRIALVGKGITYDSGGYSIKPTSGMLTMKCDMSGGAAVISAIHYLASEAAKVNVCGVVAACENLLSGNSYKPGDIIGSMAGKFIEIDNTDAEGRVTLADAVHYAYKKLNATHIIDIATLTGACMIALGTDITGVLTDQDELFAKFQTAAATSGDKVWRMPCDLDLIETFKSSVADYKNTGAREGGMITAGLFVREFVGDAKWMHLDIAGPAFHTKNNDFYPLGASGVGTEYLAELVKSLEA